MYGQNKKRKEELSIQFMPIIQCEFSEYEIENDIIKIFFKYKNIGRGEIRKLRIKALTEKVVLMDMDTTDIFPMDTEDSFSIEIPISNLSKKSLFSEDIYIFIEYTDLFLTNNYYFDFKFIVTYFPEDNTIFVHSIFKQLSSKTNMIL